MCILGVSGMWDRVETRPPRDECGTFQGDPLPLPLTMFFQIASPSTFWLVLAFVTNIFQMTEAHFMM